MGILSKYYAKDSNVSSRLTTIEIQAEIETLTGIKISTNNIRKEPTRLGFVKKSTWDGAFLIL